MSRKEIVWEVETHSPIPYPEIEGWNEELVETAGFVPLAVRFKQMAQAGIRAQFFASEFTSQDVQDMYLNHPEFDLTPEDDLEEAMAKIEARQAWINHVKEEARKRNTSEETTVSNFSDKAQPKKKEAAESVSEEE